MTCRSVKPGGRATAAGAASIAAQATRTGTGTGTHFCGACGIAQGSSRGVVGRGRVLGMRASQVPIVSSGST